MGEARKTVLLVEDNETIRDAFGILLEESGYAVVQAATGAAALEAAKGSPPDVVLLDLGLPDMPGLDVARKLAADSATASVPILAITGRALETDRDACLAAGCAGYLTKPVDTRQLLRQVAGFVGNGG
jgi:two-component system, cell cycle response regulator DivK